MNDDFWRGFLNVYAADHGNKPIHVGHDQGVSWFVFVDGRWESIDDARTLKEAKNLGHAQFDRGSPCSLKLDWISDWRLIDETKGHVANTCPGCGNPVTEDRADSIQCPDCGWKHLYTPEELKHLPRD